MILGSYTPYTWLLIKGWVGWTIWGAILAMTIAGFIYDLFFVMLGCGVSTIYLVMGWLIVLAMVLWGVLSHTAFWLLLAGGLTYSAGTIFLSRTKKFQMGHVYWHVFVLGGAGLMFASICQSMKKSNHQLMIAFAALM